MRRRHTAAGWATGWGSILLCAAVATAQPAPGGPGDGAGRPPAAGDGGNAGPSRPPGPPRLPIVRALDADGDGELSAKEIENSATALKALDTNKDGKLTRDEYLGQLGEGRGEGRGEGGRGEGGRGGAPAAGDLVKQLMAFDKNGDGKLTKDELPERMQNLVERADANKDGAVDKDELTRYAEQQQQQARGGRGEGRGGPGRGGPGGERGAFAVMPLLRALDADQNGELSAAEMDKAPAALKTLDKNNDGKLTRNEYIGEMGGEGRRGRGRGFGPGGDGGGPGPRGGENR